MAVAAVEYIGEVYSHSLQTIRRIGQVGVRGYETSEQASNHQAAYFEFCTAIGEHLKTDPELRDDADLHNSYECPIIDSQVCSPSGKPMVEIVKTGEEKAKQEAENDPWMHVQWLRDHCDGLNAEKVDAMPVGTARFVLSMDPKQQLQADPEYWEKKGYREGIAYLQWYAKDSKDRLVAGAISIDDSDEEVLREVLAEINIIVPSDISANEWVKCGGEYVMNSTEAKQFAQKLQLRYYERINRPHYRYPLADFLNAQVAQTLLKTNFNLYYPSLGQALTSHENNATIRNFAQIMLREANYLPAEQRQELLELTYCDNFTDSAGRLIDDLIQYSTVEGLRQQLKQLLHGGQTAAYEVSTPTFYYDLPPPNFMTPELIEAYNSRQAGFINGGIRAGRSYGGCNGLDFSAKNIQAANDNEDPTNPQDVYGGRAAQDGGNDETSETATGTCYYLHDGCYCCGYRDDGTPRHKQKVLAYRDPKGIAHCKRWGCNAWLSADGKRGDIGDIARKAQKVTLAKSESLN